MSDTLTDKYADWDVGPGSDCETCGWSPDIITVYWDETEWSFTNSYGCFGGHGGRGSIEDLATFLDEYPNLKQEVLDWATHV